MRVVTFQIVAKMWFQLACFLIENMFGVEFVFYGESVVAIRLVLIRFMSLAEFVVSSRTTCSPKPSLGYSCEPSDRAIFMCNHNCRLDWMFLWSLFMRGGYLRALKIILKADLKVPTAWA